MRIITGATERSHINSLYEDLGWTSLATRRKKHRLKWFYKITNGMSPEYLRELIPPTVGERQPYNLRSNINITHVLARRQGLSRSFFPTVIREWNSLPVEIRLAETLHGFSKSLDALYPSLLKRSWFSMGERFINIHHSRIRLGCPGRWCDCRFNCPGPSRTEILPIRGQIRVGSGVVLDSPGWSGMVLHGPAWSGPPPRRF